MVNESIIQVPPNVEEPIVLQRFLLRLVEELDILLGKRANSTNDAYVAQKQLIDAAASLSSELVDASNRLDDATSLLEQSIENDQEDLTQEIEDIKLVNDTQTALLSVINNFAWYRPFTVSFAGANVDGVITPNLEYNIASVTRNGLGVYDVVLTTAEDNEGNLLLDRTQHVVSYDIADSIVSQHYTVNYNLTSAAAGTFTLSIFAVERGAGNKLVYTAYDPLNTDEVNVLGLYTPVGRVLP